MIDTLGGKSIRVGIVSSIIPCEKIERKRNENNILFEIEDQLNRYNYQVSFKYLFVFPRSNLLLSLIKKKWGSYYKLQKRSEFKSEERIVIPFPVFQLPFKSRLRKYYYSLSLYLNRKKIEQFINDYQPELFHAQNADVDAFITRWIYNKYGIPYIITLRTIDKLDKMVIDNLLNAKHLIALSYNSLLPEIKDLRVPYSIIPHGVSQEFYKSLNKTEEVNKPLKFITVSRLLSYKNIDFVIKELGKLKSKIDFEYNIYGDGPEYNHLTALIKSLNMTNIVHLHGQIPHNQVKEELHKSDLFILLSYPETFGRVFVESLAVGTPFVGKINTGIFGFIEDGEGGVYCTKSNFLEKIEFIYDNPEYLKKMSINARRVAERFGWKQIVSNIHEVYLSSLCDKEI